MLYRHVNDSGGCNISTTRSTFGGIDVKIRKCQAVNLQNRSETVIYRIVYTMRKCRLSLPPMLM